MDKFCNISCFNILRHLKISLKPNEYREVYKTFISIRSEESSSKHALLYLLSVLDDKLEKSSSFRTNIIGLLGLEWKSEIG